MKLILDPLIKKNFIQIIGVCSFFLLSSEAQALSFLQTVKAGLNNSQVIKAAESDLRASEQTIKAARGEYLPSLHLSAEAGATQAQFTFADSTQENIKLNERILQLALSQPIWDFGKTSAQMRRAKLIESTALNQIERNQSEYLRAALLQYLRARKAIVSFEELQRRNTQRIKSAENSVRFKPDFSSLMQLKADLAKEELESDLIIGLNVQNLTSTLGVPLDTISHWETLRFPDDNLPSSLEEGIKLAETTALRYLSNEGNNPDIQEELANEKWADEVYPKLTAELGYKYDENHFQRPTPGSRSETYGVIKFQYNLDIGLVGKHQAQALTEKAQRARSTMNTLQRDFKDGFVQAWMRFQANKKLTTPVTEFELDIQKVEMLYYSGRLTPEFFNKL